MIKIFAILLLNIFIFLACSVRFFGLGNNNFKTDENNLVPNHYFAYKKHMKNLTQSDIRGIIVIPNKILKVMKVYRRPIGKIINTDFAIDTEGILFKTHNLDNLITVNGNHEIWPDIFKKLENTEIFQYIQKIKINEYKISIWLFPGLLVYADKNNIENINEFFTQYPEFFKKGAIIDLRNTQRLGISHI